MARKHKPAASISPLREIRRVRQFVRAVDEVYDLLDNAVGERLTRSQLREIVMCAHESLADALDKMEA